MILHSLGGLGLFLLDMLAMLPGFVGAVFRLFTRGRFKVDTQEVAA